jgi:long-chain fatty acid transport protein
VTTYPARRVDAALLVTLLSIVAGPSAAAQTSLQVPLQFDFVNPGAKSLALAGAFVGLADDATAAFANPSGLTFLSAPEMSVEFRGGSVNSPYLKNGRLLGPVTNLGIDTIARPVFADSSDEQASVSYVSLVYPHPSNRWVVAAYRHELARIDQSFSSEGVFRLDPSEFTSRRDVPQDGTRSLAITGYGLAGAYKATRSVSVGAALVGHRFDFSSEFKRYFVDDFFAQANRSVSRAELFSYTAQSGSGISFAPVVGVTVDRGRARFGAVFRHGASFDFDTVGDDEAVVSGTFRVPHTASVGASFRVSPQWIVSGEITRVGYSRLERDFVTIQSKGRDGDFSISDGTEVHASVQYAWRRAQGPPVRLRAGAWVDPDHSVNFHPVAPPQNADERTYDDIFRTALSQGEDQLHATGGIGFTLTPMLELNAGFDLAKRTKLFSTSIIVHLERGSP